MRDHPPAPFDLAGDGEPVPERSRDARADQEPLLGRVRDARPGEERRIRIQQIAAAFAQRLRPVLDGNGAPLGAWRNVVAGGVETAVQALFAHRVGGLVFVFGEKFVFRERELSRCHFSFASQAAESRPL